MVVICSIDVAPRMGDRRVQIGEEVLLVCEVVDGADLSQNPEVFGLGSLQQHRDASPFEVVDDLPQRMGAGGIEHVQVRETQDDHPYVTDRGQRAEEALYRTEEEGTVEPVRDDVLCLQRGGRFGIQQRQWFGDGY